MSGGIVDLFAGIGCVARGFVDGGGFMVAGLIDTDPGARDTYLHNHPGDNYLLGDVANLTDADAIRARRRRTIEFVHPTGSRRNLLGHVPGWLAVAPERHRGGAADGERDGER